MEQNFSPPEWFSDALEATRNNYGRIDVSNDVCPYCGCAVYVASNWIGVPKQRDEMPAKDFRASVYPFCSCAQGMESDRLVEALDWNSKRGSYGWAKLAAWYHEKIAKPDSDQHRENMLRGYPTTKLLRFIIDPNQ